MALTPEEMEKRIEELEKKFEKHVHLYDLAWTSGYETSLPKEKQEG